MKNTDKFNKSLKAKFGQAEGKANLIILAGIGILFGVLLATVFFSRDQGAETGATQTLATADDNRAGSVHALAEGKSKALSEDNLTTTGNTASVHEDPIEEVKQVFGDREALNVQAPAKLYPRAETEWQGMRVDTSMQAICEGKNSCGLAMACINNQCGPCSVNAQCGSGEVCVLDHCVLDQNTACRSAADCKAGEYCILSGYSADPRGNEKTMAYCQASVAGTQPTPEQDRDQAAEEPGPPVFERSVSIDQLQDALNEQASPAEQDLDQQPRVPSEPFDEATAEFEYEQHEMLDQTDPETEHVVVPDENPETDAEPVLPKR